MSVVLILSLLYMFCNLSRTININKKGRNIQDINDINNRITHKFLIHKKINYFYVTNGTRVKVNLNRLFAKLNNPKRNIAVVENYKNNGSELLFTTLLINNEETKFLIDLCSDNSFVFEKEDSIFNKKELSEEQKEKQKREKKREQRNVETYTIKDQAISDELYFKFNHVNIQETDKLLPLNNKQIKIGKIINIQNEKKNFSFYQIRNEELSKHFDGIIGFDFFKKFDNFFFDAPKKIIKFNNEEQTYFDPNLFYEIKLYDYKNNLKYINVNIDGVLYKGIFDTATKFTVINSKEPITDEDATIQNILKDTFKVKKKTVANLQLISNNNELIQTNLKNVFLTNFDFLDKNVVLIGLDFLQETNLFFDFTKGALYIPKQNGEEYTNRDKQKDKDRERDRDGERDRDKQEQEQEQEHIEVQKEIHKQEESSHHPLLKIRKEEVMTTRKEKEEKEEGGETKGSGEKQLDEQLIEQKSREIYEQLKNKELNFLKITKDMEKENIYLKDCRSTNDIIKKYATKLLYGSDVLKKNEKKDKGGEDFQIRYNEVTNFFKKLSNEEKQNMLNKIIHMIKKNKDHFEKASEILEEFVHYEINKNLYSLHKFKSCNVGKHNEKAFNDEFNNLYTYYNNHPDFSFEILSDFKKELASKKINFDNFNDEQEIIKKIAESRVYSNSGTSGTSKDVKRNRGMKRNIIVRRYTNDDNNVHTQIIIRRNNLSSGSNGEGEDAEGTDEEDGEGQRDSYDNISRMEDLFPNSLFSGIFRNFFGDARGGVGDNSMSNEDGTDDTSEQIGTDHTGEGENDIFSELNNLFGLGNFGSNMFRRKKKSVLGFKTKEPEIKNEQNMKKEQEIETIDKAIKEETDVDVIYLLNKVDKLNDMNLKNFILQSLKNQNIRRILVDAVKKGYTKTMEECKKENDNKGIYLLQMLKQSGIF